MASVDNKELIIERDASVLRIWLNRPDRRNALSEKMTSELSRTLDSISDDRTIRSIVIRGKGGYFCAGGDIGAFKHSMQGKKDHAAVAKSNRAFGDLMIKLNQQPQVVIMLVEGAAIGGGLGLACVADVTIVHTQTQFRLSETSLGIPPAQIAPFVTERVGLTAARRLMLTGAKFDASEAARLGIAHSVAESSAAMDAHCHTVLQQINQCAPAANAMTKAIMFKTLHSDRAAALDFAANGFAQCLLSDEGREGVSAFMEKRPASWVKDQ